MQKTFTFEFMNTWLSVPCQLLSECPDEQQKVWIFIRQHPPVINQSCLQQVDFSQIN